MKPMGEAERKRYIHSQVAQVRPQLRFEALGSVLKNLKEKDELARFLWTNKGAETFRIVRDYSGSHLALIAACGLGESGGDGEETPLCFLADELPMKWSGVDIVIKVASAAILAALTDQLWSEMEKAKAGVAPKEVSKQAQFNLWLEEGKRFIDHCRSGVGGHWYFNSVQNEGLKVVIRCQFRESAREIENKIELLKSKIISWEPTHEELTIVVEVIWAPDRSQQQATVLFTHTREGTQ